MALVILALLVLAPSDLSFVRHAETVANATGRYNARTLNEFSDKGRAQVAALTKQLLEQPNYDLILVSPSPRALKTVAPYLQATRQKATVWPLLYECCTGRNRTRTATKFTWGGKLSVPAELREHFIVEPGMDRLPNSQTFGAGLAQVAETVRDYKRLYTGRRVLLVGHSGHGGQFLHSLTGKWIKVENARLIPVHEGAR